MGNLAPLNLYPEFPDTSLPMNNVHVRTAVRLLRVANVPVFKTSGLYRCDAHRDVVDDIRDDKDIETVYAYERDGIGKEGHQEAGTVPAIYGVSIHGYDDGDKPPAPRDNCVTFFVSSIKRPERLYEVSVYGADPSVELGVG